jgi:hypothetical protein
MLWPLPVERISIRSQVPVERIANPSYKTDDQRNVMAEPRKLSIGAALTVLAGCTMSPFYQLERHGLERALPPDVAMTDKIRDGTGQEIRFLKHEDKSLKASPELLKQEQDKERELKRYFTVIEIRKEPDLDVPTAAAQPHAPQPGQNEHPASATGKMLLTPSAGPVAGQPPPVSAGGWQPAK